MYTYLHTFAAAACSAHAHTHACRITHVCAHIHMHVHITHVCARSLAACMLVFTHCLIMLPIRKHITFTNTHAQHHSSRLGTQQGTHHHPVLASNASRRCKQVIQASSSSSPDAESRQASRSPTVAVVAAAIFFGAMAFTRLFVLLFCGALRDDPLPPESLQHLRVTIRLPVRLPAHQKIFPPPPESF